VTPQRIKRGKCWATRYTGGWTVFTPLGIEAEGLSRSDAETLLSELDWLTKAFPFPMGE
jgi:hypothetical protein